MKKAKTNRVAVWQANRAKALNRACIEVAQLLSTGVPLAVAIQKTAARYRGRALGNGKRLKCSSSTLFRAWYSWKKRPSPQAFSLKYVPAHTVSIPGYVRFLVLYFCAGQGLSVSQAYRLLDCIDDGVPFSERTLFRNLPAARLRRLAKSHRALYAARDQAERQTRELLSGIVRVAGTKARSRRLLPPLGGSN